MSHDLDLTLDLMAEDLPAAQRQAHSLGLALRQGEGDQAIDLYIPYTAPDNQVYLVRLRCDGYDEQAPSFQFVNPKNPQETGDRWWPRMPNINYARGERGEVVYCTPGTREYHQLSSHRQESHPKSAWKLARVVWLVWHYLYHSGSYVGRRGV
jgi:hypothetical protein